MAGASTLAVDGVLADPSDTQDVTAILLPGLETAEG